MLSNPEFLGFLDFAIGTPPPLPFSLVIRLVPFFFLPPLLLMDSMILSGCELESLLAHSPFLEVGLFCPYFSFPPYMGCTPLFSPVDGEI